MKNLGLVLFLIMVAGCASGEKNADNSTTSSTAIAAPQPPPPESVDENQSKVLTKSKKCPKNSKLVNGKCTLQVESSE